VSNDTFHFLIPLLLGEERIYYANKLEPDGYNLMALDLHSNLQLYETPLVETIATGDHSPMEPYNRKFVIDLIQTKHGEMIIQLDSDRVTSLSWTPSAHFTVIDGASGQVVQKTSYGGLLGRCVVAKINLSTFALVSKGLGLLNLPWHNRYPPDNVFLSRIFSQQPDKTFSRTAVKAICLGYGEPAIHPLATHAYALTNYNGSPHIITLRRGQALHSPATYQGFNVDGFYYASGDPKPITLARRENKKKGRSRQGEGCGDDGSRRNFPQTERRWNHRSSVELVDGGRVLIRRNIPGTDDVFLLNFAQ
jgi:hypothetical protein